MGSEQYLICLDDPVKIEEKLMIQNTRVLTEEVETIEDPGLNEENPPLQKFPDNITNLSFSIFLFIFFNSSA
jgi:hypothetical protein